MVSPVFLKAGVARQRSGLFYASLLRINAAPLAPAAIRIKVRFIRLYDTDCAGKGTYRSYREFMHEAGERWFPFGAVHQ